MTAKRCAIYARTATKVASSGSVEDQGESCAKYANGQGWTVVGAYNDSCSSGANIDRPGLQRLLAEVAAGQVDVVVTCDVDRLSRSAVDLAWIVERLRRAGASLALVAESLSGAEVGPVARRNT